MKNGEILPRIRKVFKEKTFLKELERNLTTKTQKP
jgi:hypothetical protein